MATQNILLNSSNIVSGSKNSRLVYKFPTPQVYNNSSVAVHSLQMYYSWFNINKALYNNHFFQYRWWNATGTLFNNDVVIPDGFYDVNQLTLFLQSVMLRKGHYLQDESGKKYYFIEFVDNPTYYSIQLNVLPMYTTLPTGWSKGGNWGLPTTQQTPQVSIIAGGNFKDIIGFKSGLYPPSPPPSTLYQKISDFSPQLSPISSLVIRCNLARNDNSLPNDIIYSFTTGETAWGGIVAEKPNELYYSPIVNGTFDKLEINFLDQNFNPVDIIDPNMLITLVVKNN